MKELLEGKRRPPAFRVLGARKQRPQRHLSGLVERVFSPHISQLATEHVRIKLLNGQRLCQCIAVVEKQVDALSLDFSDLQLVQGFVNHVTGIYRVAVLSALHH